MKNFSFLTFILIILPKYLVLRGITKEKSPQN